MIYKCFQNQNLMEIIYICSHILSIMELKRDSLNVESSLCTTVEFYKNCLNYMKSELDTLNKKNMERHIYLESMSIQDLNSMTKDATFFPFSKSIDRNSKSSLIKEIEDVEHCNIRSLKRSIEQVQTWLKIYEDVKKIDLFKKFSDSYKSIKEGEIWIEPIFDYSKVNIYQLDETDAKELSDSIEKYRKKYDNILIMYGSGWSGLSTQLVYIDSVECCKENFHSTFTASYVKIKGYVFRSEILNTTLSHYSMYKFAHLQKIDVTDCLYVITYDDFNVCSWKLGYPKTQ